jgi:hypothetical protein
LYMGRDSDREREIERERERERERGKRERELTFKLSALMMEALALLLYMGSFPG